MALRSKLLAWSIALNVTTFVVLAPVHADPMTDSFLGKRGGSHKPAKKPSAPSPKPASKPAAKPASKPTSRPTSRPASRGSTRAPVSDDEFAESGEAAPERAPAPRREPPEERPRPRRSADADEPEESSFDQGASEDEEDEKPKARRAPPPSRKVVAPKKVVAKKKVKRGDDEDEDGEEQNAENKEEDEEDEGEGFASLPVIMPHLVSVALGGGVMGRNFSFAAPAQIQKESSFPRLGFVVNVEAFPLLKPSGDWWRQFGLGIAFASEPSGQASVSNPSTGMSVNTPVKQTRWGADVRYVLPLGEHVVLTPGVGLMSSSFTLSTKMPVAPSQCAASATTACLPDTSVLMFAGSGSLRIALAPEIGLSLGGMYLLGLSVKNKPVNQIGYESATSAGGFQAEAAVSYLLADWFMLRGAFPITRVNYLFHTASVAYKSAAETYYGLVLQAVLSY